MLSNGQKIYAMVEELDRITEELSNDANLHHVVSDSLDEEAARAFTRQYIRAAFVVIEAVIFATKQLAKEIADQLNQLKPGDAIMLSETTYVMTDNGKVDDKRLDIPVMKNTRFIFSYLPGLVNDSCKIDFGIKQWENFIYAIKIRNRLTHPKTMADTQISEEDAVRVREAINWWFAKHGEMMKSIPKSLEKMSQSSS